MQILIGIAAVVLEYIIRSIPFGPLIVKIKTGRNIRQVESGRTGGTNVVRGVLGWIANCHPGHLERRLICLGCAVA